MVGSNASTPQLTVALQGSTTTTSGGGSSHSATVSWDNGDPTATTYRVYRSGVSGGPYTSLNATPLSVTTYTDSTVISGSTYFYVVTEINASGVESQFSSEVSATVP
jgi:fibronectin type 3 domain-containing protein